MQHLNAFPQKAQLFKHGCDRESCLLRPNFKKGLTTWIPANDNILQAATIVVPEQVK